MKRQVRWLKLMFLLLTPSFANAQNSGSVDFHLSGALPSSEFGATLDLDYVTCENTSGRVSLFQEKGWHSSWDPVQVIWNDGPTCLITASLDDNRNDVRYVGNGTCNVSPDATVSCDVHICKQVDNGPPQC